MYSTALTKTQHQKYTNQWRELIPYGGNPSLQKVVETGVKIYGDNPRKMRAFILTLKNLK